MLVYLALVAAAIATDHINGPAAGGILVTVFGAVLGALVVAAHRRDTRDTPEPCHEGAYAGWSPVAEFADITESGPIVTLDELMETPTYAELARAMHLRVSWAPEPFDWDALGATQALPRIEVAA